MDGGERGPGWREECPPTFRIWVKQSSLSGKLKNVRTSEGGMAESCQRDSFKEEEVTYCQMPLRQRGGQEPRVIGDGLHGCWVSLVSADSEWWGRALVGRLGDGALLEIWLAVQTVRVECLSGCGSREVLFRAVEVAEQVYILRPALQY